MKYIYYVYQYLRNDGTPYYIGKGKGRRAWKHFKYEIQPPSDISRITLIAHGLYEYEAFILERKLIAYYGRKDIGTGILRNKTDGGEGSSNRSAETRLKISRANKGRVTSDATKLKISNAKTGKTRAPFSDEWKRTMSEVREGKKRNPHTEETKQKIRLAQTGKQYSTETNKKKGRSQHIVVIDKLDTP